MTDDDGRTFGSTDVQPREPRSKKFRATVALCVSTGKQKPQISVHLLSGGSRLAQVTWRDLLAWDGSRKELKTELRKAWTLEAVYSLERKERG